MSKHVHSMILYGAATCNLGGGQHDFQATQYCQLPGHLTLTAKGQLLTMPLNLSYWPQQLSCHYITCYPLSKTWLHPCQVIVPL